MLITTKHGQLRVYENGALLPTPAIDLTSVICADSERGLLGVAVDPQFASNRFIYLYYTFKKFGGCELNTANSPVNRVSRFVLPAQQRRSTRSRRRCWSTTSRRRTATTTPATSSSARTASSTSAIGDGGCDYAGDSGCAPANDAARDPHVLTGKILRITRDGGIPAGNPYQGAGTDRCNVTGRHHAGPPMPGDLRLGAAQPVPDRLRPQRGRHPLLHQRRRAGALGGDRPRPGGRRLRLERARGPLRDRLDHQLRATAGRDDEPDLRLRARRTAAPPSRAAPSCRSGSGRPPTTAPTCSGTSSAARSSASSTRAAAASRPPTSRPTSAPTR